LLDYPEQKDTAHSLRKRGMIGELKGEIIIL